MHTTALVTPAAFRIVREDGSGTGPVPEGRLAVVSPLPADAIISAGYLISALIALHYQRRPASEPGSCNYPEHILLFEARQGLDDAGMERTWGNLDIWPKSQWRGCDGSLRAYLAAVVSEDVEVMLWPHALTVGAAVSDLSQASFPRLRDVWLYGGPRPNHAISVDTAVEALVQRSLRAVPSGDPRVDDRLKRTDFVERYRRVTVAEFLATA
jgi:hypothetical protein